LRKKYIQEIDFSTSHLDIVFVEGIIYVIRYRILIFMVPTLSSCLVPDLSKNHYLKKVCKKSSALFTELRIQEESPSNEPKQTP